MNKYLRLMRFDKPIGIYLLLYPVVWSLLLVKSSDIKIWLIFLTGVVIMRAAGCVINDIADKDIDKLISRTKNRPIASGEVTVPAAFILFIILLTIALLLLLFTNYLTIKLGFIAVCIAIIYPFSKRWFFMPQLLLSLSFAMSVPMVFAASINSIPVNVWLIFITTIIWVIIYDTMYAMADRDEDIKLGIKSSAILFAKYDKIIIAILQFILLIFLLIIAQYFMLGIYYYLSLFIVALLMIYHQYLIKDYNKILCFKAFLTNNYLGIIITCGILLDTYV